MGETLASQFLTQKGLKILGRNLRTRLGEIDILAADGQTLVIVEVKTKRHARQGTAIEMITPTKQRKLVLLTQEIQQKYQSDNVRVDAVAIDGSVDNLQIKHYKGIIEYHGRS